jgi:hypothetical protein
MTFSATNQPANNGRPKGSKNKRSILSGDIVSEALKKLASAVSQGESWAVQEVLKRTHPTLKQITPVESIDGDYIKAKMFELQEMEQRLIALESKNNV